MKLATSKSL